MQKPSRLTTKPIIKLKPWGREIWFAQVDINKATPTTPRYAGKILELKKGHRYSLQYHEHKYETQYVVSGRAKATIGTNLKNLQHKILKKGDKIDVPPYTIHRLEALEDTTIFEVSTPELDDVVKLDDDYGRTGKGNNEKLDKKLNNKSLNYKKFKPAK